MKTTKMSLANIQGKLSRADMKNIMAGSGGGTPCTSNSDCGSRTTTCSGGTTLTFPGRCYSNGGGAANTCHYGGCPS